MTSRRRCIRSIRRRGRSSTVGDFTEACGEKGTKAIPQGKSHVNFVEANGKLYFATHIGVYAIVIGQETMGLPPAGYKPYPGGHFLSYDMSTGKFEDLALNPNHDGIISAAIDPVRGRLYGLTWPSAHFLRYDVARKELRDLGPIPGPIAGRSRSIAPCAARPSSTLTMARVLFHHRRWPHPALRL